MIFVDSSAWIEYFTGGPKSAKIAPYLEPASGTLISTIVLYEVYKKVKAVRGEEAALDCVGQMAQSRVAPVEDSIAISAADLSLSHRLAMADAIVYATAKAHGAKILTLDADFKDILEAVVL